MGGKELLYSLILLEKTDLHIFYRSLLDLAVLVEIVTWTMIY